MELTTDWRRQATKAAGVTALAPAALLGAAVLLAAGAGFGGLSSLGQVAGGPSLPAVEQSVPASGSSRGAPAPQAPVVALASPAPAPAAAGGGATPAGDQGAAGTPQTRANAPAGRQQTPTTRSPGTRTPARTPTPTTAPTAPSTGTSPSAPSSPSSPTQTAPVTPQLPGVPQLPGPVQQLLDLPKQLPAPIGPLTDRALQPVKGLLPR